MKTQLCFGVDSKSIVLKEKKIVAEFVFFLLQRIRVRVVTF